jgi:hypothetical protein
MGRLAEVADTHMTFAEENSHYLAAVRRFLDRVSS